MNKETFLLLDSIAWSGLSSIATFLAVIVALFLPFIMNFVKVRNVIEAIKVECIFNNQQIRYAIDKKEADFNGLKVPRGLILAAYLEQLRIDVWMTHNITIAENSLSNFSYYYDYYNRIIELKENSISISSVKNNGIKLLLIEKQFDELVELYKDTFM